MAVQIQPNGEFTITYQGPWTGIDVQKPESLIADTASPASNDFYFRNSVIKSRQKFDTSGTIHPTLNPPVTTNGKFVAAMGSLNGTPWAIQCDPGAGTNGGTLYSWNGTNWVAVVGSGTQIYLRPVTRVFNGTLYILGVSRLSSWDGSTFTASVATTGGGGTSIGGYFLDELDNHLIIGGVVENGQIKAFRLRWSASGLPNQWDETINVNAGFNDFLDVNYGITGLMMLGRVGFVLRQDGLTEMAPTGRGTAPFEFNHLWDSNLGIGNIRFHLSAQYGSVGVIVARDNIYSVQGYQLAAIGGTSRDAIFNDILQSPSLLGNGTFGQTAAIIPFLDASLPIDTNGETTFAVTTSNTPIFPFLNYVMLLNTVNNNAIAWVYSFEDNNWTKWNFPGINFTGFPSNLEFQGTFPIGFAFPCWLMPATTPKVGAFSRLDPNFNDPNQGSSHTFKAETLIPGMTPTIRKAVITYKNIGAATISLTINGTDDTGAAITTGAVPVNIGSVSNDKKLKTVLVDITLTALNPQLTISRAANGGQVELVSISLIGRVDKASY